MYETTGEGWLNLGQYAAPNLQKVLRDRNLISSVSEAQSFDAPGGELTYPPREPPPPENYHECSLHERRHCPRRLQTGQNFPAELVIDHERSATVVHRRHQPNPY